MSYVNRQSAKDSELPKKNICAIAAPTFSDQRSSTTTQLKQQQMLSATKMSQLAAIGGRDIAPVQLQNYSKTVTRPTGFDRHNWPASLSSGGSKADSSIASDVNETLVALGWTGNLMSAHMIPNRIGGKGNNSNVRPWQRSFEEGTWETEVEKKFDQDLENAKAGDALTYNVDTTDMTDSEADNILAGGGIKTSDSKYSSHKNRLKKIPTSVSANGKGPYTECMPEKPWSFLKKLGVAGGILLGVAGLASLFL